ncbi:MULTISPECIES: S24 family peptidase [Cereibacter]|uniref:S24 family peptidase n=1 Tax=Cereibacter TaxID=1653176 RepID=UPI00059FC00C|nr:MULTISPECIES: S24 family peptidase [Cereibacter]ODM42829.1 phage repressor protein [Cereibacter johrii]
MAGNMGELPHIGKGNFPMERSRGMGHFPHMQKKTLDAFVRGLQIVMEAEGIKMKPLSVAAGMGESGVRDLIRNESSPKVANAYALARELGRTVDEIIQIGMTGDLNARPAHAPIAVAGCVGAGARVDLLDAYEKGDGMYHVARPPQLKPHGIVAVEVKGESMMPLYRPGSVLFYTRAAAEGVPVEALNTPCVCEDADGRAWLKVVKVGSQEGTFSLLSLNPDADNMHGVRLKWAAPVLLTLSPDYVERVYV